MKIDVSIRLRPIRFAFLVRPGDKTSIQKIFEINTCLWGGMYNPIIPFMEKTPSWWSRDNFRSAKARDIIEGYLKFFEPDFIIEAEKGLGKKLGLPDEVITDINSFRFDESFPGYNEIRGLNVFGIYKELYQKEFKFVQRHKHNIVLVKPKTERLRLFTSCIFGNYPRKKSLSYIAMGYQDAFDPRKIILDSGQLKEIYNQPYGSPLNIGCEYLDVSYSDHEDPMVFILDASQPRDLIDFWNLRTYKKRIIAIPIQWLETLSEFCKKIAIGNHKPLPGNHHGVMIGTTFLFSRSLTKETIEIIKSTLQVEKKGAVVTQDWYPHFWEKTPDIIWSPNRAVLTASENKQEVTVDDKDRGIKFNNISPEFIERYSSASRWANIIHLREEIDKNEIATVFPASLRNPSFPNLCLLNNRMLSNTEGLITYQDKKSWYENWNVLNGTSAFIKWFKTQRIDAEISSAGKTLLQVMKSLQGFWGTHYISHPKVIERLNLMACKLSKSTETVDGQQKEYLGRTVNFHDFKREIHEIEEDDITTKFWKEKVLESLIKYNVIKLGLKVKCTICEHRNWFSLDFLKYDLVCENCLKTFSFPQDNPSNRAINWSYRVIGPFAKPDYAQGAYTSAMALRFFNDLDRGLSSSLTWSTSLELKLESGQKSEADFLLWYQRKRIRRNNYNVELVFGESKSFAKDSFEEKDLKNLQNHAKNFPGSILVCATLKDKLDADEKEIIAKTALWGRERTPLGITRAPLIVLTATELFSQLMSGYMLLWKQKGGMRAKLIEPAYIQEDNLRVLADLTQQVYLDLPSYGSWCEEKWRQKKAKIKATEKKTSKKAKKGKKKK